MMEDTLAEINGPLVDPPWKAKLEAAGVYDFGPANHLQKRSFTEDDVIAVQRWLDREGAHCGGYLKVPKNTLDCQDDVLAVVYPDLDADDEVIWNIEFSGRMIPRNFFSSWDAYEFAKYLAPKESIRVEDRSSDGLGEDGPTIDQEIEERGVPLAEMYLAAGTDRRLTGISDCIPGGRTRRGMFSIEEAMSAAVRDALDDPVPENQTTDARGRLLNPKGGDRPMLINMASCSSLYGMLSCNPRLRYFRGAQPRHYAATLRALEGEGRWRHVGQFTAQHGLWDSWYYRWEEGPLWVPAREVEEGARAPGRGAGKMSDLLS